MAYPLQSQLASDITRPLTSPVEDHPNLQTLVFLDHKDHASQVASSTTPCGAFELTRKKAGQLLIDVIQVPLDLDVSHPWLASPPLSVNTIQNKGFSANFSACHRAGRPEPQIPLEHILDFVSVTLCPFCQHENRHFATLSRCLLAFAHHHEFQILCFHIDLLSSPQSPRRGTTRNTPRSCNLVLLSDTLSKKRSTWNCDHLRTLCDRRKDDCNPQLLLKVAFQHRDMSLVDSISIGLLPFKLC